MNSLVILGGLAVGAYIISTRKQIEETYDKARKELESKLNEIERQAQERIDEMQDQYDEFKTEEANEKAKTDIRNYLKIDGFMGAVSSFYDTTVKCCYTWYVHVTNTSASNLNFHLTYCSVRLFGNIQVSGMDVDKYINIPANSDRWIKFEHGYEKAIFEKGALKQGVTIEGGRPFCDTKDDAIVEMRFTGDCYCVLQGTVNDASASLDGVDFSVDMRGLCLLLHYASWLDENLKNTVAYVNVEKQWFLNKKYQDEAISANRLYQEKNYTGRIDSTTLAKAVEKRSKLV